MMSHQVWDAPSDHGISKRDRELMAERFPIDFPELHQNIQDYIKELRQCGVLPPKRCVQGYFCDAYKVERLVMLMWVDGIWLDRVPEGLARQMNRIPVYERRSPWRFLALKRDGYVEYIPHGILT